MLGLKRERERLRKLKYLLQEDIVASAGAWSETQAPRPPTLGPFPDSALMYQSAFKSGYEDDGGSGVAAMVIDP